MQFELKKIDLFSAIKISFIVNAVLGLAIGLFAGAILAFFMGFINQMMPYEQTFPLTPQFGFLGGFFLSLFYAVFLSVINGVIITGIVVLLYNLIAGWVGGIKLNMLTISTIETKQPTVLSQSSNAGDQSKDV
ncbi:MAG: hypothetical protein B6D58_09195 [candidate division Zixibacteria bacterium 4484_95]|nr:MAG: hypothetical protein B6D58_09195 [candidate division Zixibacteria bacterium 4484_95]RKX17419.1 MAG: hypothetical protein DRP26_07025 [candidate division Zixibacteria bacterium]